MDLKQVSQSGCTPIYGCIRFLGENRDWRLEPMLVHVRFSLGPTSMCEAYLPQALGCVECTRPSTYDDDACPTDFTTR